MQSQSLRTSNVIFDKLTKQPLENVTIFNEKDNSITNAEGFFSFVSENNAININLLGYVPIKTTFEEIKKQDTIFIESKVFELNEVFVGNLEPFMKKVYDKMGENPIPNYTSDFFLRNVLKNDNTIVKLQDVYGKRNRNNIEKNSTKIEILNMRKVSLFEKKYRVELKFPDFNELFTTTVPLRDKCTFKEVAYNDSNYKKIEFEANEKDGWGQTMRGYFIIKRQDYAVIELKIEMIDNPETIPYKEIMLSGIKNRTIKYNKFMQFNKSESFNKYYLSNAKLEAELEVLGEKKIEKTFYYKLVMNYFSTNSPTNEQIKSNFPSDKDIFKAKFPYSENFWNNQNQLPLTNELKDFLNRVSENKEKEKEFEVIGNF
ncbi:peptidase associated/transthyretin-like domain-containing protein [Flavobacterium aquicola]|nr:hypothetical protein [Flavobacterium aquicola]